LCVLAAGIACVVFASVMSDGDGALQKAQLELFWNS
jgi:hypothetical protein